MNQRSAVFCKRRHGIFFLPRFLLIYPFVLVPGFQIFWLFDTRPKQLEEVIDFRAKFIVHIRAVTRPRTLRPKCWLFHCVGRYIYFRFRQRHFVVTVVVSSSFAFARAHTKFFLNHRNLYWSLIATLFFSFFLMLHHRLLCFSRRGLKKNWNQISLGGSFNEVVLLTLNHNLNWTQIRTREVGLD